VSREAEAKKRPGATGMREAIGGSNLRYYGGISYVKEFRSLNWSLFGEKGNELILRPTSVIHKVR
jgi:hypothetical protein